MNSNMAKEVRRKQRQYDVILGVFLVTILVGFTTYVLIFPWDLESKPNEVDFYYDQIKQVEQETFIPRQFISNERKDVLLDITLQYLSNVQDPENWCAPPSNKTKTLLIMVSSLRRNVANRDVIRQTWGSLRRITHWSIKLVFVMGGKSSRLLQTEELYEPIISEEIDQWKDIIMGNFEEERANRKLHLHLMTYKWALTYCSHASFILKTTDSTFVDTFQIAEILHYTQPRWVLMCGLRVAATSLGNMKTVAPRHCRPEVILLSMDIAEQLYVTASGFGQSSGSQETLASIDDQIHITGHVAKSLGIRTKNIEHRILYDPEIAYKWAHNGKEGREQKLQWAFVLIPDGMDSYTKKGIYDLWEKITKVSSLVFEFELSPHVKVLNYGEMQEAPRKIVRNNGTS